MVGRKLVSGGPELRRSRAPAATMRTRSLILLVTLLCLQLTVRACDLMTEGTTGCKPAGTICVCGFGCKNEYMYRSKRACVNAMRERNSNVCTRMPMSCMSGICIQTSQDPGFSCKCEGTGFYGQRCEKACPVVPMRGLVYPHECIVI